MKCNIDLFLIPFVLLLGKTASVLKLQNKTPIYPFAPLGFGEYPVRSIYFDQEVACLLHVAFTLLSPRALLRVHVKLRFLCEINLPTWYLENGPNSFVGHTTNRIVLCLIETNTSLLKLVRGL